MIDATPKQHIIPNDDNNNNYKENITPPYKKPPDNQRKIHVIPLKNDTPFQPRRSLCIHTTQTPANIAQAALYQVLGKALETNGNTTRPRKLEQPDTPFDIQHVCNGVVHPTTGETITKYTQLANDPQLRAIWEEAFCVELGRLAQGYKNTPGTNTVQFMDHNMIHNIPKDRTVTYTRIVIDF